MEKNRMDVFLSEQAFIGLIISSVEVFKKKCMGLLLGYKTPKRIIVEHSIPFQTADRRFTEDYRSIVKDRLLRTKIFTAVSHLELVGYFHSHPSWGGKNYPPELTENDMKNVKEGELNIMVSIRNVERRLDWSIVKGGKRLTGYVGDYYFDIAAHLLQQKEFRTLKMICPYAAGFSTFLQN